MIEKYSFGKIVVNGITYTDDIKIIKGTVVPDWWRKSGHQVGMDDVKDILDSYLFGIYFNRISTLYRGFGF